MPIENRISDGELGAAPEETQLLALLHPLPVALLAALHAHHAVARLALQALVLLLQTRPDLVPAQRRLVVTPAVAAVGADAPRALGHLDEVVVLEVEVEAVDEAKLAVVHVLAHLLLLAAGEADVVVEAVAGGVELVADVVDLVGVEVGHRDAFGYRLHLRQEL